MTGFVSLENLSVQFKVYLLILHTIVLGWIVHVVINVFYNKSQSSSVYVANHSAKDSPCVRVVHVGDKRVTVESCQWLNSILNWLYMNASNTPDLVKIWLTMLNEKIKADKDSLQFKIHGIVPGSLPPRLTNVYCSNVHSNVQCIAMHIETTKLGFYISLLENNNTSDKLTNVEVAITKLSGELIFQVLARQTRYDLTVKFIGDPELNVSSNDILKNNLPLIGKACLAKSEETTLECVVKSKDSERSAVEEKLKEVICKTVVNIPLTEGKPGEETTGTNLVPESSSSCVDTDGKLLVKIIKASGLTGIDKTDVPDVYCVITSKEPPQNKKTKTVKGTKDPVWDESYVLDVNEKTKEVAFNIHNELKTSKETSFLGQVIVPLAMIGKEQSCRLILPVLPTSTDNSYVTGQINLEFTYDKDGKAFETSTEETSSTSNVTPKVKANTDQQKAKVVEHVRPSSPQRLVFSMATFDIVDNDDDHLEFVPLVDHGIGREDIAAAEQEILERSTHGGYETDPMLIEENKKHHEMLEELIELDRRTMSKECPKTEKTEEKAEPVKKTERTPSQNASRSTSPIQISVEISSPDLEQPEETEEKVETTKREKDNVEDAPVQKKETKSLTIDETLMEDLTPNTRRKVFRKAFSMRINRGDEKPTETVETGFQQTTGSEIEKRHSFGAGENVQQRTKSGSDVSLNSLYDSTKSVLVVETRERGQIKYFQIPPLMAKRGTFDHKGTKLHICKDHLFVATHYSGTLPSCNVCKSPLTGYFGKQGYECRDCHMIAHKRCHYETSTVCTNSTLSSLKIKKAPTIHGYK